MQPEYSVLEENGWKQDLVPVFFLGIDISWLVMEEVFISPYDHKPYPFTQAMHQEEVHHGHNFMNQAA